MRIDEGRCSVRLSRDLLVHAVFDMTVTSKGVEVITACGTWNQLRHTLSGSKRFFLAVRVQDPVDCLRCLSSRARSR